MQDAIAYPSRPPRIRRSVRVGLTAVAILAAFYVAVVWGASRSADHLMDQIATDWYFLAPIMAGFGIQVGLVSELRLRHQMRGAAAVAGAAGAGSSTVGMIACCAHHIADLAPFIGATGAAAFLTDYRIVFMGVGLGVNALGVTIAWRRLRQLPGHVEEEPTCAHV